MGLLAGFNATETLPTISTSASLLLAGADVGPHSVVITNRGANPVWIKFASSLAAANASNGIDFWMPIAGDETAEFELSDGGVESTIFVKGSGFPQQQDVLAKRIPRGD